MTLMDTDQVTWLKDQVAEATGGFVDRVNEPPTYTVFDASAFGNTASASDCHAAWDRAVGKALSALTNLGMALGADVDRLDQVIASFERTDHESADEVNAVGSRMTFISSHVTNNSDRFPDDWNDYLRARQLGRLVDYSAGVAGPAAIGGDDNVSLIEDEQAGTDDLGPATLERFGDEGFENVGDVSDQGGTEEGSGDSIDHIHARGVEAGEPALVDGGPSDHHGQAVSYTLTEW